MSFISNVPFVSSMFNVSITLFDERIPKNKYTLIDPLNEHNKLTIKNYNVRELQEAIFVGGELVYQDLTIEEKQRYCLELSERYLKAVERYRRENVLSFAR